jgi:Zn-dependent peptidase ImmA (M78 family)
MAVVRLAPRNEGPVRGQGIRTLSELRQLIQTSNQNAFPLDVFRVATLLGLRVVYEQMDGEMSGFLERRGTEWVLGVNSTHNIVRQRFTAAHEIAHWVLHRDRNTQFRDETFARRSNDRNQMEREADRFSADLLMPEALVRQMIDDGLTNLNELANRFLVSPLAMKYRLVNLGYAVT